ncbi:hypothetical protein [Hymenobacter mucosus]|uniref:GTPase n=1 Tax=Hymenobacter mucosus TaxID=1411120 RepID=A0A238V3C7_9BACT|nr:hypothetical protein [Hymenobacter mucosus]SNR28671.1 hypothetical protein SAMN06269173_10132 [Hymenobacter mucosus]
MEASLPELLFVYNANAGALNGLLDTLHKTLSPSTYACSLCAVTYGAARMRPEWREFLQSLPVSATFLHRNELAQQHPSLLAHALPAVFYRATSAAPWQSFLTAAELQRISLAALMQLVQKRLATIRAEAIQQ